MRRSSGGKKPNHLEEQMMQSTDTESRREAHGRRGKKQQHVRQERIIKRERIRDGTRAGKVQNYTKTLVSTKKNKSAENISFLHFAK